MFIQAQNGKLYNANLFSLIEAQEKPDTFQEATRLGGYISKPTGTSRWVIAAQINHLASKECIELASYDSQEIAEQALSALFGGLMAGGFNLRDWQPAAE